MQYTWRLQSICKRCTHLTSNMSLRDSFGPVVCECEAFWKRKMLEFSAICGKFNRIHRFEGRGCLSLFFATVTSKGCFTLIFSLKGVIQFSQSGAIETKMTKFTKKQMTKSKINQIFRVKQMTVKNREKKEVIQIFLWTYLFLFFLNHRSRILHSWFSKKKI